MEMTVIRIVLVILLTSFSAADAKTLYVDVNDGSCSDATTYANNSISNKWCNLSRAVWGSTSRLSQDASQAAAAGDTVLVAAGTYHNGTVSGEGREQATLNPANSGTVSARIVFQCVTPGACILTHTITAGDGSPIIGEESGGYQTWDGFRINTINAQNAIGVNAGGGVISFHGATRGVVRGITVQNFTIDSTGVTQAGGDNYPIVWMNNSQDMVLRNNEFRNHHTASGNDENVPALTTYFCDNIIVEHNNIHDIDNGLYIKGGASTNVVVRYNLIYNNAYCGYWQYLESGSIYQNIFRDCGNFGLRIGNETRNLSIYNNTIDNSSNGISWNNQGEDGYGDTAKNNIITNTGEPINGGEVGSLSGWTINYNVYYTFNGFSIGGNAYSTIASWRAATPFDDNSQVINPLYVDGAGDNFRLQAGSPARTASDTGGPVGAYITGNELIGYSGNFTPVPPPEPIPLPEPIPSSGSGGGGGCSVSATGEFGSEYRIDVMTVLILLSPTLWVVGRRVLRRR